MNDKDKIIIEGTLLYVIQLFLVIVFIKGDLNIKNIINIFAPILLICISIPLWAQVNSLKTHTESKDDDNDKNTWKAPVLIVGWALSLVLIFIFAWKSGVKDTLIFISIFILVSSIYLIGILGLFLNNGVKQNENITDKKKKTVNILFWVFISLVLLNTVGKFAYSRFFSTDVKAEIFSMIMFIILCIGFGIPLLQELDFFELLGESLKGASDDTTNTKNHLKKGFNQKLRNPIIIFTCCYVVLIIIPLIIFAVQSNIAMVIRWVILSVVVIVIFIIVYLSIKNSNKIDFNNLKIHKEDNTKNPFFVLILIGIIVGIEFVLGVIFKIIALKSQKANEKTQFNSYFRKTLLVFLGSILIGGITFLILLIKYRSNDKKNNKIHAHREANLLAVYENPSYKVDFGEMETEYYNKNYNADVTLFLRDYYISSSFRSYCPDGFTDGTVSLKNIGEVLDKGARLINLDLYYMGDNLDLVSSEREAEILSDQLSNPDNPENEVVVGLLQKDGQLMHLPGDKPVKLLFDDCCKLIAEKAWKKCDYPLILYLNLQFDPNKNLEKKIFNAVANNLGNRTLGKEWGFSRGNIGEIPIKKLMEKMIIIFSHKPQDPQLYELSNAVISPSDKRIFAWEVSENEMEYGGLETKYVDRKDVLEHTKFNLSMISYFPEEDKDNYKLPKRNAQNYNFKDGFDLGFNCVLMNFQSYGDDARDNNYMEEYIEFFKKCSFIVKPEKYRYIQSPPPAIKSQSDEVSYANRNIKGYNGFYEFNY